MKKIYMYVDNSDEFLLPLAIAESATELAQIAGTSRHNVLSTICHGKTYQHKTNKIRDGRPAYGRKFEKIEMEDDEWNEAAADEESQD